MGKRGEQAKGDVSWWRAKSYSEKGEEIAQLETDRRLCYPKRRRIRSATAVAYLCDKPPIVPASAHPLTNRMRLPNEYEKLKGSKSAQI